MATGAVVGLTVATTLIQAQASKKEAQAQEKALKQRADAKKVEAFELLARFKINAESLRREGEDIKAAQVGGFAKAGVEVSTGSPLSVLLDTNIKLARELGLQKREADFKAAQLRRGADIDIELAGDVRKAEKLKRIGIFFSGAQSIARIK